jgi:hypothetical protein
MTSYLYKGLDVKCPLQGSHVWRCQRPQRDVSSVVEIRRCLAFVPPRLRHDDEHNEGNDSSEDNSQDQMGYL